MTREPGLFDAAPSAIGPLYFLTNRHNLLAILGSRLIGPRFLYTKHYPDLLDLAPGRTPLLAHGCGQDVAELVVSSASSFPVLIELAPGSLEQRVVPALAASGVTELPLGGGGGLVWAPASVIPLDAATRVHFRTDGERHEHELREYENIDPSTLPLEVSAHLFAEDGLGAGAFGSWLSSLPLPRAAETDAAGREDRRSGGCMLALAAARAHPVVADAVSALLRRSIEDALAHMLGPIPSRFATDAVAAAFGAPANRQEWRPVEIAEELAEGAASRHEDALEGDLRLVRAILRNEDGLGAWEPSRTPLASAVLMALLRPEAGGLLGWSGDRPGGDAELVAAASLAGMVAGRRRMPIQFRPAALDAAMARAEALALSQERLTAEGTGPQVRTAAASLEIVQDGVVLAVLPVRSDLGGLADVLDADSYDSAALLERLGPAGKLFDQFLLTTVTADPAALDLHISGSGDGITATFMGPVDVRSRLDIAALSRATREGGLTVEQVDALRPCVSPPPPRARRRSARGTRTG